MNVDLIEASNRVNDDPEGFVASEALKIFIASTDEDTKLSALWIIYKATHDSARR